MSNSPPFYPSSSSSSSSSSKSPVSTPQANNNTYEPFGSSCQQMAETKTKEGEDVGLGQREGVSFSPRAAAVSRRHSVDAALTSGLGSAAGQGPVGCLHPYQRQFSDGAVAAAGRLPQGSSSLGFLQETSYPDVPAAPVEPSCFSSQNYPYYRSTSPLRQIKRMYPKKDAANRSKYSVSTQSLQESAGQSTFSKPIYSYSILIFMALKSSKTGSLPVSEIYGFMTENFPYFKTAPDGWKNSVRHNLSLNKCFVKVENKNGNSSRKGCLWALNPAKVEKMQEELHKWRRKDPISVRRSMARPECLDRLLGEKPDKVRSLPPYLSAALFPRVPPVCNPTSTSCTPALLQPSGPSVHHPQHHHVQSQQPCYLSPPAAAHPSSPFALYSPCGRPPAPGSLNSPMAGKMPPDYSAALQAEYSFGPRSIQDFLLEVDSSYDIDTLNPSLTDLQLQGNLWEELREDSLVSDPQVTTTTCFTTSSLQDHYVQTLHAAAPPVCQRGEERETRGSDALRHTAQYDCMNGFHPAPHSGYVTSCTTSVSLM